MFVLTGRFIITLLLVRLQEQITHHFNFIISTAVLHRKQNCRFVSYYILALTTTAQGEFAGKSK